MALQNIPEIQYPTCPIHSSSATPGYSSLLIDAAGETASFIFAVPKTGNIRKVHFRTATVTSSGTLDCRLETVDMTTGTPSGTLVGTNTNASQTGLASNTWYNPQLTADAAVTAGQIIALSIVQSTGNLNIACFSLGTQRFPYTNLYTGTWAKGLNCPVMALEYDDGSIVPIEGCYPYSALTLTAFNSGSTPDERGNKIILNAGFRTSGFWIWIDGDGNDWTVTLYDSGGSVIEAVSFDKDLTLGGNAGLYVLPWTSKHTLAAGTYRLTVMSNSTTNVSFVDVTVNSSGLMAALEGGTDIVLTTRTDGGVWGDSSTQRAMIGLLVDAVDIPSGGSGGISRARALMRG